MNNPFERYKNYVLALEVKGERLPTNQYGNLNFAQIAKECGNRRQWFSENIGKIFSDGNTLKQIIEFDCNRLGTKISPTKKHDDNYNKSIEISNKEKSKLHMQLMQKTEEIEILKMENKRLQQENIYLKTKVEEADASKEELLDTGRRFTW